MRLTSTRLLALALATLGAAACSDPAGPPAGTTPVALELCSGFGGFGWLAYQNEGGAWTQLSPNFSGSVSFDATEKVSLAVGFSFFGTSFTQVINATAAELNATGDVPCELAFGTRTMSGTVAGLTGDQYARLSASTSSDDADAFDSSWSLEDLPSTGVDIVATRYATFSTQPANRVLVRRNVVAPNGPVPALDFAGTESAAPENAIVTLNGIPANGTVGVATSVLTANGTLHDLGDLPASGSSSSPTQAVNFISLPASLRIASDEHILTATTFDVDGVRTATHYYKTPAATNITFGPMVPEPVVTNTATSPYVRPRATLASQTAYPGAVLVQWTESSDESSARVVAVMTTAGFLGGTPQNWTIEVPDMSSANYDPSWGLQSTDYSWAVSVYSATGPTELLGQQLPADGTTVLSATRGSVETLFGTSFANALRARNHRSLMPARRPR